MPFDMSEYVLYSYLEEHPDNIEDIRKLIMEFKSIQWEVIPQ